jgi:hypothetical protein
MSLIEHYGHIDGIEFSASRIGESRRIFLKIAFAGIAGPLRPRAAAAFEEFTLLKLD